MGIGVVGDAEVGAECIARGGISNASSFRRRSSVADVNGVGDGSSDISPDVDGDVEDRSMMAVGFKFVNFDEVQTQSYYLIKEVQHFTVFRTTKLSTIIITSSCAHSIVEKTRRLATQTFVRTRPTFVLRT